MNTHAAGASAFDQFKYAYFQAPPIARTLTAAIVILSWFSLLIPIIPYYYIVFIPGQVFRYNGIPQLWRLVTSFFVSGSGLSLILDPYFFWTYTSQLERDSPRFALAGDLPVFFLFVGPIIMTLSNYLFGGYVFLSPLTLALVYMYANDEPDRMMNFFFINIRAKFLPYCMLLITLLMGGPIAMVNEATGLVAAHLYDFLTRLWPQFGGGTNYVQTPALLRRLFAKPAGSSTARRYGTAFEARNTREPPPPPSGNASGGGGGLGSWASGFSSGGSGTWGSRGRGQRLGGD